MCRKTFSVEWKCTAPLTTANDDIDLINHIADLYDRLTDVVGLINQCYSLQVKRNTIKN